MKSTDSILGKMTGKFAWLAMTVCLTVAGIANANDGVVSDAIIHRAGLQVEWFSHSGIGVRGKIVDWHLNVNENKPTTFFTVRSGAYRENFSQNKLSPFGKPYGVDDAIEYAGIRKEILAEELKARGVEAPQVMVDQYTLPESTVYLLTNTGGVKAIDADTGKIRWQNQVGDASLRAVGIGADNAHVAVLIGKSMYCLNAENGKLLWSTKCRHAPSAPPSVAEEFIYVPLLNGRLEKFEIENKGALSKAFVGVGEGISRPVVTELTVSWSTGNGQMHVAGRWDGKTVAYKLQAEDGFESAASFDKGTFYAGSLDGFIYAVDEKRGSVRWQVSTGAAIKDSPVPLGDSVYVINTNNELFKLSAKNGSMASGWEQPRTGISRFIGAGKTQMFVLDKAGNLKILSQESGAVLSSVPFGQVDKILVNRQSNRLYVASRRGTIQCIREVSSPIPHFHANEFGVVQIDPADMAAKKRAAEDKPQMYPQGGEDKDPFKALNDPFAGSGAGAPAADDPFAKKPAADNDPFGSPVPPKKTTPDDPFGGGGDEKDPFK